MFTGLLLALSVSAAGLSVAPPLALCGPSCGEVQERLYLIDGSGGVLVTYDPVTLERLSIQYTGLLVGMQSLTFGQGRLYSIEFNIGLWMDKLISIHPATAQATAVGPTGVSYSTFPSIKYDSTRDAFFVLYQEFTTPAELWFPDLYRIDPATGQMTYIARVTNDLQYPLFYFYSMSMAIGPAGDAFVSTFSAGTGGPGVGRLDLQSGVVEPLGRVPMGVGRFRDMSFDSLGRMWVIYDDFADDSKDGIYTVDPVALTFEPKLLTKEFPLAGMNSIAVVPLPPISTYCEPSSATTCAPRLSWKGLPSATADSGFPVLVRGTPSTSTGRILFGKGVQAPPFAGSILCFAPPYHATAVAPSVSAGTAAPCDGTWSTDLNAAILAAGFAPGDTLRAQWIGLDPAAPPGERHVTSDALEFELAP